MRRQYHRYCFLLLFCDSVGRGGDDGDEKEKDEDDDDGDDDGSDRCLLKLLTQAHRQKISFIFLFSLDQKQFSTHKLLFSVSKKKKKDSFFSCYLLDKLKMKKTVFFFISSFLCSLAFWKWKKGLIDNEKILWSLLLLLLLLLLMLLLLLSLHLSYWSFADVLEEKKDKWRKKWKAIWKWRKRRWREKLLKKKKQVVYDILIIMSSNDFNDQKFTSNFVGKIKRRHFSFFAFAFTFSFSF